MSGASLWENANRRTVYNRKALRALSILDILDLSGTNPEPITPPQKAAKRSRNDAPRDAPHSERESPASRYVGKGPRAEQQPLNSDLSVTGQPSAAAHPLSFQIRPLREVSSSPLTRRRRDSSPTPVRSSSVSLVDLGYDADQAPSPPIEEHPFFDAAFDDSIAPSPSVLSPSPSGTAPSQPPSPSLTATPDSDDPMDDAMPEPALKVPTREEWLAATPTCMDENPHRPSAVHDPSDPQALAHGASFQSNEPTWNAPVIPDHVALDNLSDETVDAIRAAPGNYLAVTVFCSGAVLNDKYKNMRNDALAVLEEAAGKGKVTLIRPVAKNTAKEVRCGAAGKPNKFSPPIALVARCTDKGAHDGLTGQGTFGASRALAFHVTLFNALCLSWAVGFFRTDIDDPPAVTARRLCLAVYEGIIKSSKLSSLIDHATQGGSSTSRDQRILDFAMTFEARFLAHAEDPVYVLMAKPCTKNPKLWDEIRAAMRTTYTESLEAFIPHANAASGHNICADCKLDCHPKYNCMFTVRDKSWWGPLDLASALRDLRGGADSDDEDEGSRRGAPRGRATRGFRSGSRNRGR
ncbi:hypothetical protein FB451DRAFT_1446687 [Mycena latifolia]|nr:hypothetical protein FB451DRAFT_1446687 [Mycena latifolia]